MSDSQSAKTIAIINQKGGVGKSTITTLLANILYFRFNKKVAIIDADDPQQSIYKRNLSARQYISKKPHLNKLLRSLYEQRLPIQIYPSRIKEAESIIKKIQDQYDVIFLDITGTLEQEGLKKALLQIQYFFIPVLQDSDTLQSSLDFFQYLKDEVFYKNKYPFCYFFMNRVSALTSTAHIERAIQKVDGRLLKVAVPNYVIYERGFRSTLLPIPNPKDSKTHRKEIIRLFQLAQEVLLICSKKGIVVESVDEFLGNADNVEQEQKPMLLKEKYIHRKEAMNSNQKLDEIFSTNNP